VPAALRALRLPMSGNEFGGMPPDTPQEFKTIAPRLLAALAACADPDGALAGIERIALAVPNRAQLYASMDDSPDLLELMVDLAAASPPLTERLTMHLEWLEGLAAEERDTEPLESDAEAQIGDLGQRLIRAEEREKQIETIARYYLREILRIGVRDVRGWASAEKTMSELSRLVKVCLHALITVCAERIAAAEPDRRFAEKALGSVAAIGLGKLGGEELGYASDWDIVFVYEEDAKAAPQRKDERYSLAQRLVESVISAVRELALYGAGVEMDLRLRPWGRKGSLLMTPMGYQSYFESAAEMWERQASLKARYIAGQEALGRRMEQIFQDVSVRRKAAEDELQAVRAMKRRIENERLRPEEQLTNIKLGFGGLSDVEWLTQLLQLTVGSAKSHLCPNTVKGLSELVAAGTLEPSEGEVLRDAYLFLTRVRNALWLYTGRSLDTLVDADHIRILARRFGYAESASAGASGNFQDDVHRTMRSVREIFERRFYAAESKIEK